MLTWHGNSCLKTKQRGECMLHLCLYTVHCIYVYLGMACGMYVTPLAIGHAPNLLKCLPALRGPIQPLQHLSRPIPAPHHCIGLLVNFETVNCTLDFTSDVIVVGHGLCACDVVRHSVIRCAMPCHAMPCHSILCGAVRCGVMRCGAVQCAVRCAVQCELRCVDGR